MTKELISWAGQNVWLASVVLEIGPAKIIRCIKRIKEKREAQKLQIPKNCVFKIKIQKTDYVIHVIPKEMYGFNAHDDLILKPYVHAGGVRWKMSGGAVTKGWVHSED